jgi:hypothetical protein
VLRCFGRGEVDGRGLFAADYEVGFVAGLEDVVDRGEEAVRVRGEVDLRW